MQPPPRKGNYGKYLKGLHSEQLAKLQLKNQHECELLEDIRQFTIKRSAIEKTYSESLLKISSLYLNKKMVCIPEIKLDGTEKWNMWSVWQTVLEENEKLAKARLAAIEVFQQQIADEAKGLREYKIQISKKCLNQLGNIQKELQTTVQKIDITKKSYFDEEHSAHGVRDKARDIEEKLKKKKGSFFQSITSLQKNSARVTSRKEELEEKSTGARNDYLLSLAQANAHQNRYFTVDLQTTMTTMENYVFERIADYLTLMGRTELLTCSATQHSFTKIRDQAHQLTRDYNVQCLYLLYPVLKQHIHYDFEACDNDPVRKITAEHDSAAATLSREAKLFASKIVRENNSIRDNARKLTVCQQLRDSGQRTDPNDSNGPDLETKIEEFREKIRKSETEKAKSEACLECLRIGGVNVDEWIEEAETLGIQELPRSSSSLSMRTDASGHGEHASSDSFYDSDNTEAEASPAPQTTTKPITQTQGDDDDDSSIADSEENYSAPEQPEPQIEEFANWDDPTAVDWGAADSTKDVEQIIPNSTTSVSTAVQPTAEQIFKCIALYSYNAQNPDELTIVENEQLEVIGDGDGDGWLRARNYRGEEGYVPHNYLDVERDLSIDANANQALSTQISFSSVDYTVECEEPDVQSPDQVSVIAVPVQTEALSKEYCIALYDYDASADDELTFEENQIITIINKSPHGVDDGWWEGELNGTFGNFPSLVVEECDQNGEPLTEPDMESPEAVTPPTFDAPPPIPPEYYKDLEDAVNEANLLNGEWWFS
ncbi:protein nervous wreck [Contarinia nasturtii]|uniref:protein nervous wreck n=1 Tax=Contarinia nasturtii TaxID=265458 RepID=UPI0012D4535B|nr:protein nervous wreck [Contarinia nasturtii]